MRLVVTLMKNVWCIFFILLGRRIVRKNNGFTLVELAIVMMIIGLLLGGILKGQKMVENARVTSFISQVNSYQAALVSFQDAYSALPGDMLTATMRIPNCTGANFCVNGDGNSIVGLYLDQSTGNRFQTDQSGTTAPQVETTMFWKHLVLTDLISGVNGGANPAGPAWGETHPSAKTNGGFGVITFNHAGHGGIWVVNRSSPRGSALLSPGQNPISPRMAEQIDRKMDDGQPDEGFVQAPDDGTCDNRINGSSVRTYLSTDQHNCVLAIHIL